MQATLPGIEVNAGAQLSRCGRYRYRLWRWWDGQLPILGWVMLNPSTADGTTDDPTIRRCVGFAKAWGFGSIEVVNLYAWRATDPADLYRAQQLGEDIIGPDYSRYIERSLDNLQDVVLAWGANFKDTARVDAVTRALETSARLHTLGLTNGGHPRHPLYVRSGKQREPYNFDELAEEK